MHVHATGLVILVIILEWKTILSRWTCDCFSQGCVCFNDHSYGHHKSSTRFCLVRFLLWISYGSAYVHLTALCFISVLEAEVLGQGPGEGGCIPRSLHLACRLPAPRRVFTWPCLRVYGEEGESELSGASSYKDTNSITEASPSWAQVTPITSRRPRLQTPSHEGFGFQHMNLGGQISIPRHIGAIIISIFTAEEETEARPG